MLNVYLFFFVRCTITSNHTKLESHRRWPINLFVVLFVRIFVLIYTFIVVCLFDMLLPGFSECSKFQLIFLFLLLHTLFLLPFPSFFSPTSIFILGFDLIFRIFIVLNSLCICIVHFFTLYFMFGLPHGFKSCTVHRKLSNQKHRFGLGLWHGEMEQREKSVKVFKIH